MSIRPEQVVASFDSASVLHAATAAALRGEAFPHLGNPALYARLVRIGGHLPWPLLRQLYARIGGAEGIERQRLGEVDLAAVASSFADGYPRRQYPGVLIGSSNGALTQLAAAMQIPWLPQTVLVPVKRVGDPHRPDQALEFGRRWGPDLLTANPDVVLHQMHDPAQDELMTARMTYFRTKWRALPAGYRHFFRTRLQPGAPIMIVDDRLTWPVQTVGERHWFQTGGVGGLSPQEYLQQAHSPPADAEAPEAEWGADPDFVAAIQQWGADHDHPVLRLSFRGPQQAAHPVAAAFRRWLADRGEPADRMIISSFVLGDPWTTLNTATVPYWTFFPVRSTLADLEAHLQRSERYRRAWLLMFQHGADSPGRATAEDYLDLLRRHGVDGELVAVDPRKSPHDIGSLGRYGAELARIDRGRIPWSPMPLRFALRELRTAGRIAVTGTPGW